MPGPVVEHVTWTLFQKNKLLRLLKEYPIDAYESIAEHFQNKDAEQIEIFIRTLKQHVRNKKKYRFVGRSTDEIQRVPLEQWLNVAQDLVDFENVDCSANLVKVMSIISKFEDFPSAYSGPDYCSIYKFIAQILQPNCGDDLIRLEPLESAIMLDMIHSLMNVLSQRDTSVQCNVMKWKYILMNYRNRKQIVPDILRKASENDFKEFIEEMRKDQDGEKRETFITARRADVAPEKPKSSKTSTQKQSSTAPSTSGMVPKQSTSGTMQKQSTSGTILKQSTSGTMPNQLTSDTILTQSTSGMMPNQSTSGTILTQSTSGMMPNQSTSGTILTQSTSGMMPNQSTSGTILTQSTSGMMPNQSTSGTILTQSTSGMMPNQSTSGTILTQSTSGMMPNQSTSGTMPKQSTSATTPILLSSSSTSAASSDTANLIDQIPNQRPEVRRHKPGRKGAHDQPETPRTEIVLVMPPSGVKIVNYAVRGKKSQTSRLDGKYKPLSVDEQLISDDLNREVTYDVHRTEVEKGIKMSSDLATQVIQEDTTEPFRKRNRSDEAEAKYDELLDTHDNESRKRPVKKQKLYSINPFCLPVSLIDLNSSKLK